jgi:hypothetical protein
MVRPSGSAASPDESPPKRVAQRTRTHLIDRPRLLTDICASETRTHCPNADIESPAHSELRSKMNDRAAPAMPSPLLKEIAHLKSTKEFDQIFLMIANDAKSSFVELCVGAYTR